MKTKQQHSTNNSQPSTKSELLSRSEQVSGSETAVPKAPDRTLNPQLSTFNNSEFQETAPAGPWRGVFFDGPEPDQDHEGEEIPVWLVYVGDEEAEPIGTVYHVYNFTRAQALAERIAKDRRLELINEAATA